MSGGTDLRQRPGTVARGPVRRQGGSEECRKRRGCVAVSTRLAVSVIQTL
jgi:hypothetical protein